MGHLRASPSPVPGSLSVAWGGGRRRRQTCNNVYSSFRDPRVVNTAWQLLLPFGSRLPRFLSSSRRSVRTDRQFLAQLLSACPPPWRPPHGAPPREALIYAPARKARRASRRRRSCTARRPPWSSKSTSRRPPLEGIFSEGGRGCDNKRDTVTRGAPVRPGGKGSERGERERRLCGGWAGCENAHKWEQYVIRNRATASGRVTVLKRCLPRLGENPE